MIILLPLARMKDLFQKHISNVCKIDKIMDDPGQEFALTNQNAEVVYKAISGRIV